MIRDYVVMPVGNLKNYDLRDNFNKIYSLLALSCVKNLRQHIDPVAGKVITFSCAHSIFDLEEILDDILTDAYMIKDYKGDLKSCA